MALESKSKLLRKDCYMYHVTQKNDRSPGIFVDAVVANLFIKLMVENLKKEEIYVWNYSIMPTHYHILVCAPSWRILARALQRINTSFSQSFPELAVDGRIFSTQPKYEPITTQFTLLNLMTYIFRNPRKICCWKNYWKSGAWEYTLKQLTVIDPQGLDKHMGITIEQLMEIVDSTINHDDKHFEVLTKVCLEHPVPSSLFCCSNPDTKQ